MYNQVLSGIDSERRSSAQLIASYQARIESSKQEALNKAHEPILNVKILNEEVLDMMQTLKERITGKPILKPLKPSVRQVLDSAEYALINAGDPGKGLSYNPVWFDFLELLRETGIETSLQVPKGVVQVPFEDALQAFVAVKGLLLTVGSALATVAVAVTLEDSAVATNITLNVDGILPVGMDDSSVDKALSFETQRSSQTTLVIQFRLSNIGTW